MGAIGQDTHSTRNRTVSQPREAKLLHTHLVGSSGTGKSALLLNLIAEDMANGEGVGVIDPHGDLAEAVLACVPPDRKDDVLYFNAGDFARPIGFNPLDGVAYDDMPRVTGGLLYALRSIWGDTWGESRMQFLIQSTLLPLLEKGDETLLGVQRFLTDEDYRNAILWKTKNPAVRWYWREVFDRYQDREKDMYAAPIHHHIGQFAGDFAIRNIIGQKKDRLRLKERMDKGQIFIANLSKGDIGHTNANFLGSLLVALFSVSAMQRTSRKPFYLYVDEFQAFSTDSFAEILTEARKYGLGMTLAHQYFGQLTRPVREAVLGNTGTLVAFRVGEADGELLSHITDWKPDDFTFLDRYAVLARMEYGGQVTYEEARTFPPPTGDEAIRREITKQSRKKYGVPREKIERKIKSFYKSG